MSALSLWLFRMSVSLLFSQSTTMYPPVAARTKLPSSCELTVTIAAHYWCLPAAVQPLGSDCRDVIVSLSNLDVPLLGQSVCRNYAGGPNACVFAILSCYDMANGVTGRSAAQTAAVQTMLIAQRLQFRIVHPLRTGRPSMFSWEMIYFVVVRKEKIGATAFSYLCTLVG